MYTELQLQFIRRFGRKDLEFGCIVLSDNWYWITVKCIWHGDIFNKWKSYQEHPTDDFSDDIKEILGHEPHLFPDVARAVLGIGHISVSASWVINVYTKNDHKTFDYNPTLPLLQQESVMQQLLDLFPDNNK